MSRDINLTSAEWCELVFEGKNQKYGAYYLRKTSSKRHIRALLIVITVTALLVFIPSLIARVIPEKVEAIEGIDEAVKMTSVNLDEPKPEQQALVEAPPPPALKAAIQFVPPIISKDATDDDNIKTQEDVTKSNAVIFSQDIKGSDSKDAVDPSTMVVVKEVVAAKPVAAPILDYVEQMPKFPGGDAEMLKFLKANINYPIIAAENDIQGRVFLKFAVMPDGSINNITVLRSLHRSCDEEAIRAVKSMPKWIPGKQNGVAVAVYYQLPVTFTLGQR